MRILLPFLLSLLMLGAPWVSAAQALRGAATEGASVQATHVADPCHDADSAAAPEKAGHSSTHTGSCAALCALLSGFLPVSVEAKAVPTGKPLQAPHMESFYLDALVAGLDRPPNFLL